jgi:hypothetical protein
VGEEEDRNFDCRHEGVKRKIFYRHCSGKVVVGRKDKAEWVVAG